MCTVLLRIAPGQRWPLLLAAVRDEFLERAWDPPGRHWPASAPDLVGGRDRTGHGTWLAVRPTKPAVAALLNGVRLPPLPHGARPTRGSLPLAALAGSPELAQEDLDGYDGFHLLVADADGAAVSTWDGTGLQRRELPPGDHIVVNAGIDLADSPLVAHFAPKLSVLPAPEPSHGLDTQAAWGPWVELLRGDGLPGDDPRALIVRRTFHSPGGGEHTYGSSSASLIAVGRDAVRFDFTATPAEPRWQEVPLG